MKKATVLSALILTAGLFSMQAKSQSIVDPGVSVHNYKHPNKAAKAKALEADRNTVRVPSLGTVERYSKQQHRQHISTTPKYAPRPAALVVTRRYNVEGVEINPLNSPRNYKTPHNKVKVSNSEIADYHKNSDKSIYPTVD
ncbi:hypothetical protein FEM33_13215 [Dyadobacter flavalbus]|uniref:Uncharacterized protein n=1 Tax=Dyadobacter flavalbus TaxID=2579942 RepID=A0A5M8QV77_9BACT|nr:hypothetical protein [Dyadobacter flavalbus]KAA6439231.1 hypothetical protein FEM33_13215 [Dyadobacter flavalbus]